MAALIGEVHVSFASMPAQNGFECFRTLGEAWRRLAAFPTIGVPAITMEGDANGAPHPEPDAYARKFTGGYEHRLVTGGISMVADSGAFSCGGKRYCKQMTSCAEADSTWSSAACPAWTVMVTGCRARESVGRAWVRRPATTDRGS
nr:hypothetical protein [Geminicoccus flavidas]